MSDSRHTISRRRVITATASLPFAVAARRALADDAADASEVESLARKKMNDDTKREVRKKADDARLPMGMFKKVDVILWEYFALGVEQRGKDLGGLTIQIDDAPDGKSVPYTAFELMKDTLKETLDKRSSRHFPDDGKHPETNVCAFMCGHRAAGYATSHTPSIVRSEHFTRAFNEIRPLLGRRNARAMRMTKEDLTVELLGLGC